MVMHCFKQSNQLNLTKLDHCQRELQKERQVKVVTFMRDFLSDIHNNCNVMDEKITLMGEKRPHPIPDCICLLRQLTNKLIERFTNK